MLIGLTLTTPAWPAQPNSLSPVLNNSPSQTPSSKGEATIDEDAADYLLHIDEWPIDVHAIELVRELCERTVATMAGIRPARTGPGVWVTFAVTAIPSCRLRVAYTGPTADPPE